MDSAGYLLSKLEIDGKIVTKRCTESYLKKHNLLQVLDDIIEPSFGTVSDRIKYAKYGGGYCKTCGVRTAVSATGRGFAEYCKHHFHDSKKNKVAHNAKHVDVDKIVSMYSDGMSMVEIANEVGEISNVTIKKKLISAGVQFRTHSENQKIHSTLLGTHSHLYDKEWWEDQYKTKSSTTIADELGCSPSLVLQRLQMYNIPADRPFVKDTTPELAIHNMLASMQVDYIKRDRNVLNGRELDIFIPSHNLAIEVNGIFWHSAQAGKNSKYHVSKTNMCESKGITLLQFWDAEISSKPEIVKSVIQSKLGMCERIYARKCTVVELSNSEAREFFERTHMQGHALASNTLALTVDGQIMCAASFTKPRFNKSADWELLRFSSELGITVVGGASKLLSRIDGSIISYANRRWSRGQLYTAMGFERVGVTHPAYSYTNDFKTLHNRMKFQKHKLRNSPNFSNDLSEHEIMALDGFTRVWDCGNITFIKR